MRRSDIPATDRNIVSARSSGISGSSTHQAKAYLPSHRPTSQDLSSVSTYQLVPAQGIPPTLIRQEGPYGHLLGFLFGRCRHEKLAESILIASNPPGHKERSNATRSADEPMIAVDGAGNAPSDLCASLRLDEISR